MPGDPYYWSASWRALRARRLEIDRHTCTTPGCGAPAVIVDHIVPRKQGGPDTTENTRSLCRACDNRRHGMKSRDKGAGKLRATGSDASGAPRDPNHPWHRSR